MKEDKKELNGKREQPSKMFCWEKKSESHLCVSHISRSSLERDIARNGYGVTYCVNMVMGVLPLFKGWHFAVSEIVENNQGCWGCWWLYDDVVNDILPSLSYWSCFVFIFSLLLLCSFLQFLNVSFWLGFKPTSGTLKYH